MTRQSISQFLKDEFKKPLKALKAVLKTGLRWILLLVLRSVLWLIFFLLPILIFLFASFHWVTEKAREYQGTNT